MKELIAYHARQVHASTGAFGPLTCLNEFQVLVHPIVFHIQVDANNVLRYTRQ